MARTLKIEINAPREDSWLAHKILNFKEDVYGAVRRLRHPSLSDISAIDRAYDPITITAPRKRDFDSLASYIEDALGRNEVSAYISVTKHVK